ATGKANAGDLYPARMPRETRWIGAPLAAIALAVLLPLLLAPKPPEPPPEDLATRALVAQQIQDLLKRHENDALGVQDQKRLEAIKNLAERIKDPESNKKDLLAELAKLQSQLDKEKQEAAGRKLELEKNAAKLASGEDAKDAKRDMDAGRFREAANKVKKKLEELEKQLAEEQKKSPPDKAKIEQLKKRI